MAPEEFRKLLLQELDSVHRLAYHLSRSPDEADELVQETFLRAFRSASTFQQSLGGARPWLFKILHNAYRTRLGRKYRDGTMGEIDAEVPAPPPAPPLGIQWEQVDERLKKAVGDLPEAQRTVLLLWAVEGLKYRQIADVTEVAIGTVMSRLFRARQTLGEQLKDLAAEQRLGGGEISVPLQTP